MNSKILSAGAIDAPRPKFVQSLLPFLTTATSLCATTFRALKCRIGLDSVRVKGSKFLVRFLPSTSRIPIRVLPASHTDCLAGMLAWQRTVFGYHNAWLESLLAKSASSLRRNPRFTATMITAELLPHLGVDKRLAAKLAKSLAGLFLRIAFA